MRTLIPLLSPILLGVIAGSPLAAQLPAPPAKPAELAAVPTDSFAFLTVNAGKLWENPGFKPLREWFAAQKIGPTDQMFGVTAAELDRVTLFLPTATLGSPPVVLVATRKAYNEAKVLKALGADHGNRGDRNRVGNAVSIGSEVFQTAVLVDERTLMFLEGTRDNDLTLAGLLG